MNKQDKLWINFISIMYQSCSLKFSMLYLSQFKINRLTLGLIAPYISGLILFVSDLVGFWKYRPMTGREWTGLPYSDKRKQLLKMTFLVNEQDASDVYIDINEISLCLDLNIFQQDECFCSKVGLEVERAKSNLKYHFLRFGWFVTCFLLSE